MAYSETGDTRTRVWGITTAGLGRDDGGLSTSPLMLSEDPASQPSVSRFQDPYAPLLVRGSLRFGGQSIDPFKGRARQGSFSFRIIAHDRLYPEVSRYFMKQSLSFEAIRRNLVDPNTVEIQTPNLTSAIDTGSIIYHGREAWRVESVERNRGGITGQDYTTIVDEIVLHNDSAPYFGSRTGDGRARYQSHFGTFANTYRAYDPLAGEFPHADERIWLTNPFIRGREVTLWWSDCVQEYVFGRYVIESFEGSAGNAEIQVNCRDALETMREATLNRDAVRYDVTYQQAREESGYVVATLEPDPPRADALPLQPGDWEAARVWGPRNAPQYSGDSAAVLQFGSSAVVIPGEPSGGTGDVASYISNLDVVFDLEASGRLGSEKLDDGDKEPLKDVAFELLVSNPGIVTNAADHPFYDPAAGEIVTHHIDLVRAFLGTQETQLPYHWIGETPLEWILDEEFIRLRDEVFPGWDAPGLIAGKDGKPVKMRNFCESILRGMMATFTIAAPSEDSPTRGGKLSVTSIFDLGTAITADLPPERVLDGRLQSPDLDVVVDVITSETGFGLDGVPRAKIWTRQARNSNFYPYTNSLLQIDNPVLWDPERPFEDDDETAVDLQSKLTRAAQLFRQPPMIITANITGQTVLELGQYVTISAPGWRSPTDGMAAQNEDALFYGYVLRRDFNPNRIDNWDQRLQILALPVGDNNRIGPGGAVNSAGTFAGVDFVLISTIDYIRPLNANGEYAFSGGVFDSDADQFKVGQFVNIYDRRGDLKIGPLTISGIIESPVNSEVQFIESLAAYSQAAGDRLELADAPESRDEEVDRYAYGDLDQYGL